MTIRARVGWRAAGQQRLVASIMSTNGTNAAAASARMLAEWLAGVNQQASKHDHIGFKSN